jgi:hypothetical protein
LASQGDKVVEVAGRGRAKMELPTQKHGIRFDHLRPSLLHQTEIPSPLISVLAHTRFPARKSIAVVSAHNAAINCKKITGLISEQLGHGGVDIIYLKQDTVLYDTKKVTKHWFPK